MKKIGLLLLAALWILLSCDKKSPSKPNIIFIMMDDLGYGQFAPNNEKLTTGDFDPFFVEVVNATQGYDQQKALEFSKIAMPTISKLAEESVVFTKAYTSSSLCAASRLGIATGRLQNRMGVYRNIDCEKKGLDPNSHLAETIHAQGYATAHIGKWHVGTRRDQMIIDALKNHGIQDTLSYQQVRNLHPDVFEELFDAGYYGSVIDKHNPLQNGFDYYFFIQRYINS